MTPNLFLKGKPFRYIKEKMTYISNRENPIDSNSICLIDTK